MFFVIFTFQIIQNMKSSPFLELFFLSVFLYSGVSVTQAQVTNDESAKNRQEAAIAALQKNIDKFEAQLTVADSLISVGNQMMTEAKSEIKSAENDRKKIEKEYLSSKKTLEKKTGSKNKEEAAAAKADLKSLDSQYKQDIKHVDLRLKEANKKSTDGIKNIEKGKNLKKNAGDGLKKAKTALEEAQAKLDAMKNPPQEKSSSKKKK